MLRGLIVSIQGYTFGTTRELAKIAANNGACAVRSDHNIPDVNVIYLKKTNVKNRKDMPYISVYEKDIASCDSSYIAIDSRMCNNNIKPLYRLAKMKGLKIVGDIRNAKDYENLIKCGCVPDYVATTFSVFDRPCNPEFVAEIKSIDMGQKVIAEGGYSNYNQIESAINNGACAVCIGREITGIDLKTIGYKGIIDAVHN